MNPIELLTRSPLWSQPPLAIAVNVAVLLAFLVVAGAVVADFKAYYRQSRGVVRSATSLVETGSMTAFFIAYYLIIRLRWLEAQVTGRARSVMLVAGLVLVLVGAAFNVWGRVWLGSQWANQIKIYEGHRLVSGGPFAVVRHPLYASLIWTFVGGSMLYSNPVALAVTLLVFVPMMYARARREESLLVETFDGAYTEYRARTGMFLPKIWRPAWRT